jgi:hypothetical protein
MHEVTFSCTVLEGMTCSYLSNIARVVNAHTHTHTAHTHTHTQKRQEHTHILTHTHNTHSYTVGGIAASHGSNIARHEFIRSCHASRCDIVGKQALSIKQSIVIIIIVLYALSNPCIIILYALSEPYIIVAYVLSKSCIYVYTYVYHEIISLDTSEWAILYSRHLAHSSPYIHAYTNICSMPCD